MRDVYLGNPIPLGFSANHANSREFISGYSRDSRKIVKS